MTKELKAVQRKLEAVYKENKESTFVGIKGFPTRNAGIMYRPNLNNQERYGIFVNKNGCSLIFKGDTLEDCYNSYTEWHNTI